MTYCSSLDCEVPDDFVLAPCQTRIFIDIVGSTIPDTKPLDELSMADFRAHLAATVENGFPDAWGRLHAALPNQVLVHPETGLPNECSLKRHICACIEAFNTLTDAGSNSRLFQPTVEENPRPGTFLSCIQYVYDPVTGRWHEVVNLDFSTELQGAEANLVPPSFSKPGGSASRAILRITVSVPSND